MFYNILKPAEVWRQGSSEVQILKHQITFCSGFRAKEIKTKLGVLLQKPENAIDLIIPYPEKTEKKPEKQQK